MDYFLLKKNVRLVLPQMIPRLSFRQVKFGWKPPAQDVLFDGKKSPDDLSVSEIAKLIYVNLRPKEQTKVTRSFLTIDMSKK